jgi:hypothetical protein
MDLNRIKEIYKDSYYKYDDLYKYFFNYCGFQIKSSTLSKGFLTWRIRDYQNLSEIRSREDVQYPPKSTTLSRIGKPNQIWFYISDGWEAAHLEMLPTWYKKVKPGNNINIVLTRWQIREQIKVLIIPDLNNINVVCKNLNLDSYFLDKQFWELITNKFGTTTLEDKNIYEFTAAFSNALITRAQIENKEFDGIFYPSVQYKSQSNLALLPEVVDEERIVLYDIFRAEIVKSSILTVQGLPQYRTTKEMIQGYYEPNKNIISWE